MRISDSRGQATVEFVAVVPLLLAVVALGWQLVVAGHTAAAAAVAARAAARADAVGADRAEAARRALPRSMRRGLRVDRRADGTVVVRVPLRAVVAGGRLLTVTSSARFAPEGA